MRWRSRRQISRVQPPLLPVNMESFSEAIGKGGGGGVRHLSFLPIFILTLWKTRRPSSSTAMPSPWLGPFSRLNGSCPPRRLVPASPVCGYSRGFAHLCSPESDCARCCCWSRRCGERVQPQRALRSLSSSGGRGRGRGSNRRRPHAWCEAGDVCPAVEVQRKRRLSHRHGLSGLLYLTDQSTSTYFLWNHVTLFML